MAHRTFNEGEFTFGNVTPVQTPLEKVGQIMRHTMQSTQYYSPRYDYWNAVTDKNHWMKNYLNNKADITEG